MTNGWTDVANSDVILVMGGNPAENHPVGFRFAIEAKRHRNARLVCIDPRFNRTAAVADQYVPIRSGSDIAFLGGLIHYALDNDLFHANYVKQHTNASFLVAKTASGSRTVTSPAGTPRDELVRQSELAVRAQRRPRVCARRRDARAAHVACSNSCGRTTRAIPPSVSRRFAAVRHDEFEARSGDHLLDRSGGAFRHDPLRARVDSTQPFSPAHPRRGDAAAPPRQHRYARGRSERPAGAFEHPGRDRHGRMEHAPRLRESASRASWQDARRLRAMRTHRHRFDRTRSTIGPTRPSSSLAS